MTSDFVPRIALVGLSGTGKSTLAAALMQLLRRNGYNAKIVKLSAPLYRLQDANRISPPWFPAQSQRGWRHRGRGVGGLRLQLG